MAELTLEALAQRLAELEQKVATLTSVVPPARAWQSVAGMFKGSEFQKQVDAEIEAMRAAERQALDEEVVK